jgi:hypothetical protein
MRKLIILMVLGVFTFQLTYGQVAKQPCLTSGEKAQQLTDQMLEKELITKDQYEDVLALNESHFQKLEELNKQIREQRKTTLQSRKQLFGEREKQLEEVLTPEQLEQLKAERMKRRESGKPAGK